MYCNPYENTTPFEPVIQESYGSSLNYTLSKSRAQTDYSIIRGRFLMLLPLKNIIDHYHILIVSPFPTWHKY